MPDKITTSLPGSAQEYVDQLKHEVAAAQQALDKANAEYNAKLSAFNKAAAWETQLKKCVDALGKTDLLSKELDTLLIVAKGEIQKVGQVAECAVIAFRHMLNDVETVATCIEKYKCDLKFLIGCFPKGPNSGIADKDPLVEAFNKLLAGLEDALKCALQLLVDMLSVYENGNMLWKGLSSETPNGSAQPASGLYTYVSDIKNNFNGNAAKPDCSAYKDADCNKPAFPLKDHGNALLIDITTDYNTAHTTLYGTNGSGGLRKDVEDLLFKKNQAQTCYDALKSAYEAALAAKNGKK